MGSFGEYLRAIREEKGLGIDQIAQKTRINPSFIRALEEDEFESLPGETFAKGFLTSYARSLGLDESETLKRFKDASSAYFQKTKEGRKEEVAQVQKASKRRLLFSWMFQGVILAGIGVAVWVVYDLNSSQVLDYPVVEIEEEAFEAGVFPSGETELSAGAGEPEGGLSGAGEMEDPEGLQRSSEPETSGMDFPPATDPLPVPPLPESEFSESVNLPAGLETKPPRDSAPELVLIIEAIEPSWILARIDDELTKEVFLQIGEKVEWTARDHFRVDFGNAGGINVTFKGEPLPSLGESGEVVKNVLLD